MKPPVLVVGPRAAARAIATALQAHFAVTVEDDPVKVHALASTGAHLAIVALGNNRLAGALELDPSAEAAAIVAAVSEEVSRQMLRLQEQARRDRIGALPYDEYIELMRYVATRRYLVSLLEQHRGSVTDAARGAGLKRESLHRLLRKHHIDAEDFRPR